MTDQEIRVKSWELAFLMLGKEYDGTIKIGPGKNGPVNRYTMFADDIEEYFHKQQYDKKKQ